MNTPLLFEKYIIRWIGTYKEPWFITKDIAKILGYKDTKKAVGDNIDTKYILTWKEFKKDKEIKIHSQTKLINKTGVICFLQSGRKCNQDFLLFFKDNFKVDYHIIKRLTKEEEYISNITKTFEGEEMIQQYSVCNNKYKIDLYFPKYNLAVECDEYGHKDRNVEYEYIREVDIKKEIDCVFMRFNPDDKCFNLFKFDFIFFIYEYLEKNKIKLKNI